MSGMFVLGYVADVIKWCLFWQTEGAPSLTMSEIWNSLIRCQILDEINKNFNLRAYIYIYIYTHTHMQMNK